MRQLWRYRSASVKWPLHLLQKALAIVVPLCSTDPAPQANIEMTRQIANAARPLGMQFYDRIIVGRNEHVRLKVLNLI